METKTVYIHTGEEYPVYSLYGPKSGIGGDAVQLTEDEIKYINRATRMYDKAQEIMRREIDKLAEQAEAARQARRNDPDTDAD